MRRGISTLMVATALSLMLPAPTARAATARWDVYPGLQYSGLWEYGWHFDEGSPAFGARDYNFNNDNGAYAQVLIRLTQNSVYPIRLKLTWWGQCGTRVIAQAAFGLTWVDIDRTEMHYIHVDPSSRLASPYYTYARQNTGDYITAKIGYLGACGTPAGAEHLHQSADLATGSRIARIGYASDTCWSDTDDFTGTNTYQCPRTDYKAHDSTVPCPPGAWNGNYWLVSGTVANTGARSGRGRTRAS